MCKVNTFVLHLQHLIYFTPTLYFCLAAVTNYIHYIASANYPYIFSNVHYATEHGEGSFLNYQTRGWNETIGPVKKGFNAWVRADNGTSTCKIQVSKNGSAFATKATGSNRASFTINY